MLAYLFFAIIDLFLSFSFSLYIFLTLLLSLYLIQKSPMRDLSKYKHISRILLESSRLVYRVSYISAFVYSVRKMHINTEVHFDASSATPGNLSHCSFDGDRYPLGSIIATASRCIRIETVVVAVNANAVSRASSPDGES